MHIIRKAGTSLKRYLSRNPNLYALVVGIGIVLFWRGVWHSVDYFHLYLQNMGTYSSMNVPAEAWWDGILSFIGGCIILYFTGAFKSSFIGNELILSGLRGEKKFNEKTEEDLRSEVSDILDIKDELTVISQKLEMLEIKASKNHTHLDSGDKS